MKINNFRVDLTDVSAKKEALYIAGESTIGGKRKAPLIRLRAGLVHGLVELDHEVGRRPSSSDKTPSRARSLRIGRAALPDADFASGTSDGDPSSRLCALVCCKQGDSETATSPSPRASPARVAQ